MTTHAITRPASRKHILCDVLSHYKRLAPTVEEMAAKDLKDVDSEVTITKLHSGHSSLSRMLLDN